MKICMITEVLKSEDCSDMKINLIEEILEFKKQSQKEVKPVPEETQQQEAE